VAYQQWRAWQSYCVIKHRNININGNGSALAAKTSAMALAGVSAAAS